MSTEFYTRVHIRKLKIKECGDIGDYKECPICSNDFGANEYVALLKCYHIFHEQCIKIYINTLFKNKIRQAIHDNVFPKLLNYDFNVCPFRCDTIGEQRRCIKNKANVHMRLLKYIPLQLERPPHDISPDIYVERFDYWSLPHVLEQTFIKHKLLFLLSHCTITYECEFFDHANFSAALSPRDVILPLTIMEGRLRFLYAGRIDEDVSVCKDKHECTEALFPLYKLYNILNTNHIAYVTFKNKIYKIEIIKKFDANGDVEYEVPNDLPWYSKVLSYVWGSGKRKKSVNKRVKNKFKSVKK
jgi:hypothetical protein